MSVTDVQLDFIGACHLDAGADEIARAFRVRFRTPITPRRVVAIIDYHARDPRGERQGYLLTWAQHRFLKNAYASIPLAEAVGALNRRCKSTFSKKQVRCYICDRTRQAHREYDRFAASSNGRFRKGHRPVNQLPPDAETVRYNGGVPTVFVKVDEPNPYTGSPARMKRKAVVVWEQNRGALEKGECVVLIDGDPFNCEIDNLVKLTRAELVRLNQMGWNDLPPNRELRLGAIAAARLKQASFDIGRTLSAA